MTLLFIDKIKSFDFDVVRLSKKVIDEIFQVEKLKNCFSVNISIVGKRKIKTLNRSLRGVDKSTDVLSFPNVPFKKQSDIKTIIKNKLLYNSVFDQYTKSIFLGDIVICYDKVISQAKKFNHSIKREYSFLLTHAMLHLLGYDHMSFKDEEVMIKKQDLILNNLKIFR